MNAQKDYFLWGTAVEQHGNKLISKVAATKTDGPVYFVHELLKPGHSRFTGRFTTLAEARTCAGAPPPTPPTKPKRR